jgi:hypothetical protein
MPAYILRAVERTGSTRLIDDLDAAAHSRPRQLPFSTPILADDFATAWNAFVAAHGKRLSPFSISSSSELEAMQDMITEASGGSGSGCLLFGVPARDQRYSSSELLDMFSSGQALLTYAEHPDLRQGLIAAAAKDPTTIYFGGVSSAAIKAELDMLEELTTQHLHLH